MEAGGPPGMVILGEIGRGRRLVLHFNLDQGPRGCAACQLRVQRSEQQTPLQGKAGSRW